MLSDKPLGPHRLLIHRHVWVVRLTHWVNAATLLVMLLSGLQILCAHPAFYWGETARFAQPFAAIDVTTDPKGDLHSSLSLAGLHLDTTGVLGTWRGGAKRRGVVARG